MLFGFVAAVPILWSVGLVVALIALVPLVPLVLGHNGRRIGRRSHSDDVAMSTSSWALWREVVRLAEPRS